MPDRKQILEALECCVSPVTMCNECPYGVERCRDLKTDILALLKEQDSEKKRIMKVIWDVLHEGFSIDTIVDQDWVYEQIRHRIEDI